MRTYTYTHIYTHEYEYTHTFIQAVQHANVTKFHWELGQALESQDLIHSLGGGFCERGDRGWSHHHSRQDVLEQNAQRWRGGRTHQSVHPGTVTRRERQRRSMT